MCKTMENEVKKLKQDPVISDIIDQALGTVGKYTHWVGNQLMGSFYDNLNMGAKLENKLSDKSIAMSIFLTQLPIWLGLIVCALPMHATIHRVLFCSITSVYMIYSIIWMKDMQSVLPERMFMRGYYPTLRLAQLVCMVSVVNLLTVGVVSVLLGDIILITYSIVPFIGYAYITIKYARIVSRMMHSGYETIWSYDVGYNDIILLDRHDSKFHIYLLHMLRAKGFDYYMPHSLTDEQDIIRSVHNKVYDDINSIAVAYILVMWKYIDKELGYPVCLTASKENKSKRKSNLVKINEQEGISSGSVIEDITSDIKHKIDEFNALKIKSETVEKMFRNSLKQANKLLNRLLSSSLDNFQIAGLMMQLSNNIDAMLREVKTHGVMDSKQQADDAAFNVLNEAFKKKLKSIEEDLNSHGKMNEAAGNMSVLATASSMQQEEKK